MNMPALLLCFLLPVVALFSCDVSAATRIQIDVDQAFVDRVHALFEAKIVAAGDLEAIAATAGARALINKVRQYAPHADEALLKEALRRAAQGEKWGDDPFYFWRTYRQREKTRDLVGRIGGPDALAKAVTEALAPYLPEEFVLQTRIVMVLGGASAGWTTGDGNFQVGLDHHANDPIAVIEKTAAHEIYHVAQEAMLPPEPSDLANPDDRIDALLRALIQEGTASLQDDFSDIEEEGDLLTYIRDKQKMNRQRIGAAFLLLETLVLRTAIDPEANLGTLYEIGFLDPWGSSGYEVGRVMAEAIVEADGAAAIPALIQAGPRAFVQRYAEISAKAEGLPVFTQTFVDRLTPR